MDLYNLDAPEGLELKVFERSKAVGGPVMIFGDVTCASEIVKLFAIGGGYGVYGTNGGLWGMTSQKWLDLQFAGILGRLMTVG